MMENCCVHLIVMSYASTKNVQYVTVLRIYESVTGK